jgi:hypothetical protein
MAPVLEGKSIGLDQKQCSKESSCFEEPRIRLGIKVQSNSRIQFVSNQSKLAPSKLDPCLKSASNTLGVSGLGQPAAK